jgi:hypothetical protein
LYCNGSWFNKCTIKARDEQTVLSEITLEINYFLKHTELERKGINSTVGMCSRYNLVAVKAEEIRNRPFLVGNGMQYSAPAVDARLFPGPAEGANDFPMNKAGRRTFERLDATNQCRWPVGWPTREIKRSCSTPSF